MIQQLSPPMQRIVAVLLAVLALLCAVTLVIIPLVTMVGGSLSRLEDSRFLLARARALQDRPPPPRVDPVPPTLFIAAPKPTRASEIFAAALAGSAGQSGATVSLAAMPQATADGRVTAQLSITGTPVAVALALSAAERGTPAIRFSDWRMTRTGPQQVRFEGQGEAAWSSR